MRGYSIIATLALLGFASIPASATNLFDDTVATCPGVNCSSLRLPGSILNEFGGAPLPWTAEIFKGPNECMRLDIFSQAQNLEMVAVAPDGTVYRNDNRTGADFRPLVKVPPIGGSGWYTVQISNFDGSALEADFVLLYGRYDSGNRNCASPTPPL